MIREYATGSEYIYRLITCRLMRDRCVIHANYYYNLHNDQMIT